MQVVLATVGTRGDVQPMLALAQALEARGHRALVACPASFGDWVRSLGLTHAELGEDLQARMETSDGKLLRSLSGMRGYFAEQMALQAPRLVELAQDAQVIAGTAMAWMVRSAAEKLGIAAVGVLPSSCVPSRLHPPPMLPVYGLPRALNGFLWWLNDAVQNRLMLEPVNRARTMLGLQPLASFTQHLFGDDNLLAVDAAVFPPDPAWQGRYPYIGFPFLEDRSALDPALAAFLDAGDPPVYVGFGSMTFAKRERVAACVCEAVERLGQRCVVSGVIARTLSESGALPSGFFLAREAPHAQLFPRCAAIVHHGGAGTTAAALRAGTPQVILPVMLDQFHHAHHLARAGLAPAAPRLSKITSAKLTRALQQALASPMEPRQALAQRLHASDAGGLFVERLLQLSAAKHPERARNDSARPLGLR
jgi:vancomycin aglycone glucosyltransferase